MEGMCYTYTCLYVACTIARDPAVQNGQDQTCAEKLKAVMGCVVQAAYLPDAFPEEIATLCKHCGLEPPPIQEEGSSAKRGRCRCKCPA